jgi:hypothetical protein
MKSPGRVATIATLFLLVGATLALALVPAYLIQPFRHQSPGALRLSFLLKRWGSWMGPLLALLALLAAARLWPGARGWWRRPLLVLASLLALLPAWFVRQNHFEWMFHPPTRPSYAAAGETGTAADEEMVLAVAMGGEAVAYPIRQIAYHHLVQDVVGGVPVVATY